MDLLLYPSYAQGKKKIQRTDIVNWQKKYKWFDEIWLPISQIENRYYNEELKEDCIDVSDWYF